MKRFFSGCLAFLLFSSLLLTGCRREPYAKKTADLCERFSLCGTVYTPLAKEGEVGYVDGTFFETLYGEGMPPLVDYAVFYAAGFTTPGEWGIFRCLSDADALTLHRMLRERIDRLAEAGRRASIPIPAGAVKKSGRCVIYAVTENAELVLSYLEKRK